MTTALGAMRDLGGMAFRWSGMAATAVGGICALKGASGLIYHGGILAIKVGPTGLLSGCCNAIKGIARNVVVSAPAGQRGEVESQGKDDDKEHDLDKKFREFNSRVIQLHVTEFKKDGAIFLNGLVCVTCGFLLNGVAQSIFKGALPSFVDCTKFDILGS